MTAVCLATSVPPVLRREVAPGVDLGARYQRLCVESWAATGWRVLSVNPEGEVARIRAAHPGLEVAPVARSAEDAYGRPFVWIEDLFAVLEREAERDGAEVVGVVNSDIWLALARAEREAVVERARGGALVLYNRAEIRHLGQRTGPLYRYGYDLFLMPAGLPRRAGLDLRGFALGVPWWDYWLALNALLREVPVVLVQNPSARHLTHAQNWNPRHWEAALGTVLRRMAEVRRGARPAAGAGEGGAARAEAFLDGVMDGLVGSIRFDANAGFLGAQINHGVGTLLGLAIVGLVERHAHRLVPPPPAAAERAA